MNGDAQRAAPTEPMGCAKAAAATKGPDQVQGRRDFYAILKGIDRGRAYESLADNDDTPLTQPAHGHQR